MADFSKLHILPGSIRATPLVKSISFGSPNNGMKITKLTWTYGLFYFRKKIFFVINIEKQEKKEGKRRKQDKSKKEMVQFKR